MDHRHVLRAWESFICDGIAPRGVRQTIAASWQRCHDHNVVIERAMAPLAEMGEIYRHRSECCTLVNAARPVFGRLSPLLGEADAMLILTDKTGLVLETHGDARVIDAGRSIHLESGGQWSEADIGTNAIGTAAALCQPVQIHGAEHFCAEIQKWTCAAAPVRHPVDREVLGIIDISGPASKFVPQSLAMAVALGNQIEDQLARSVMLERELLLRRCMVQASRWSSDDVIVIDRRGAVVHAGAAALRALANGASEALALLRSIPFAQWQARLGEILPQAGVELVLEGANELGALLVLRARPAGAAAAAKAPARRLRRANVGEFTGTPSDSPAGDTAMIAEDPTVRAIVRRVEMAARRGMSVMVLGETGTGKEQLARHAHAASGRRGAFVPVNCAAIPANLVEAELFGYADGAFTGGRRGGSDGLVQEADGGTLFLDEIGDMPLALQAVVLRMLDDRMVRPIGGTNTKVDVLLVSATNVSLDKAIAEGRFRADLLYRINTLEVTLPRLCERADFAAIARHLLAGIDPHCRISAGALQRLAARPWPGNIRELRNVLARYTLSAPAGGIDEDMVAASCMLEDAAPRAQGSLHDLQNAHVLAAYAETNGNVSETARRLGISRNTVYRCLEQAGLR
jgi:transcriptional regulator of acetoin/glycerol metabolism